MGTCTRKLDEPNIGLEITSYLTEKHPALKNMDDSTALLSTGMLDSLSLIDLVDYLERSFGIRFEAEELVAEHFETVSRIETLIRQKMG